LPKTSLPRIRTEVHGDTLSIDAEISRTVWQWFSGRGAGRTPRVTIHFKDVDRIEAAVQPFQRDRGQIRLSTVSTFASHWLIPRVAQFQARHPRQH